LIFLVSSINFYSNLDVFNVSEVLKGFVTKTSEIDSDFSITIVSCAGGSFSVVRLDDLGYSGLGLRSFNYLILNALTEDVDSAVAASD